MLEMLPFAKPGHSESDLRALVSMTEDRKIIGVDPALRRPTITVSGEVIIVRANQHRLVDGQYPISGLDHNEGYVEYFSGLQWIPSAGYWTAHPLIQLAYEAEQ